MKKFSVTKSIHFCYGHRLLNYEGKCKHLHGHNGKVEIEISKDQCDERGMVVDFSDISKGLEKWIKENLDHKMVLCKQDVLVKELQRLEQPVFIMENNPTAESIAKLIFTIAKQQGFAVSEVRLWETPTSCACYQE